MTESKTVVTVGWRLWERSRKEEKTKMFEEIWGDEGYVNYVDYSDGFTGVYVCQNLSKFTL